MYTESLLENILTPTHVEGLAFKVTFNNISVISWQSVLLVEETRENYRHAASNCQTLSHNVVLSTPCHERGQNSQH